MRAINFKPEYLVGGVVLLGVLYLWARGAKGVGQDVGGAAVGVASGVVKGVGSIFGVPDTNADKCAAARAAGDLAGVSFYCPAITFGDEAVSSVVNGAGHIFGVPDTNQTECQKAMAEGRTWDASFACDAGTFLKYMTGR